jgi:hypothetical protein
MIVGKFSEYLMRHRCTRQHRRPTKVSVAEILTRTDTVIPACV